MRMTGRWLVVGWLGATLVLLAMDGRLPVFLAGTAPASLLVLGLVALVRWQRRPSMLDQPSVPERYRVADDLRLALAEVVAAAEQEAEWWG
jgi:hypothetical protein